MLKVPCKGNCKYFLISSLKPTIPTHIQNAILFFGGLENLQHTVPEVNLIPNVCKLAGIQYFNLHFSVL